MFSEIKDTYSILEKKQKKKSFFIVILILLNVCLEIIALFLLYDFIRLATSSFTTENILKKNEYLHYIFSFLNLNYNFNNLLIFILFAYVIKFFFTFFFNLYQYSFLNSAKAYLTKTLFEGYLRKDFSFYKNNNPTNLIRNTETEVSQFVLGCFMHMIFMLTEGVLISGIIITLFFVNAKIVIYSIFFLFLFSFLYLSIIKPFLLKYGNSRIIFSTKVLKDLSEGFYGIKSVKLYDAENFFINSLKYNLKQLARANIFFSVISQIPKNSLELLLVFVILIFYKNNIQSILTEPETVLSLGFFALASFKILPSVSKIILGLQSLKYNKSAIHIIKSELDNISYFKKIKKKLFNKKVKEITFDKKIILKNIFFKYPDDSKPIFKKLNLIINKGDKIGIMGISGSGKSTLVDIITTLLDVKKGFLQVDDTTIRKNNKLSWISKIGYVPQKTYLTDDTIRNNIAFGQSFIEKLKIDNVINQLDLGNVVNSKKEKLGQDGIKLSGGQIQRIGIARCLYKNPELLIFDEATSSLDIDSERKILSLIKKISKSKTLIMISHNPQNLRFCNKIYKIENGLIKKLRS
jgi:ABC-type multidrug transport system fused ATPase/permease subunit